MEMKKVKLEDRMYDVVKYDELRKHPELYRNNLTAVELEREDGTPVYLPYRTASNNADRVGVYNLAGSIDLFVYPEQDSEYSSPSELIDMQSVHTIRDYSQTCKQIRNIKNDILTNPDNIFIPPITGRESPEMRGLKEAIALKSIDIDLYADRFGDNFPNDKRQFKGDSITLFMMKRMCNNLDMQAHLILKDAPDAPNPMGQEIIIDLTGSPDPED